MCTWLYIWDTFVRDSKIRVWQQKENNKKLDNIYFAEFMIINVVQNI